MNKLTSLQLIDFVLESITLINKRFKNIKTADDFLYDDDSITRFEAILMRLQASGEALKNLSKRDYEFLLKTGSKEYWSKIIRMRDLISHHYTDLQADEVFDICQNKLNELNKKILKLKEIIK